MVSLISNKEGGLIQMEGETFFMLHTRRNTLEGGDTKTVEVKIEMQQPSPPSPYDHIIYLIYISPFPVNNNNHIRII